MLIKSNKFGQYGVVKTKFSAYYLGNGELTITKKTIKMKKTVGDYSTQFGIICKNNTTVYPCKCIVVKARKTVDMTVNLNAFIYPASRWIFKNDISREWRYYAYHEDNGNDLNGIEIQLFNSNVGSEVEISEIYALPYIPESLENIDKSYLVGYRNKYLEVR